jgi:hypothetical protein
MKIDELLSQIGANEPTEQPQQDVSNLLARLDFLGGPTATVEEDKLEEELSSFDLTLGTARAFTEGMTLGWGDEAGLFLAALGAKASGAEESVGDLYRHARSLQHRTTELSASGSWYGNGRRDCRCNRLSCKLGRFACKRR